MTKRPDQMCVAVLGAGLMGHSIAGVFAAAGASVRIYEPVAEARAAAGQRIAAQQPAVDVVAITCTDDLEAATARADLVVEAAPENLDLKRDLFGRLGELLPDTVLATNTSGYRVTEIARGVHRPERVVGTHWFNPPHLVPLVEVTQGEQTSDEVVVRMLELHRAIGKAPVHVRRDVPGFIGNRLQAALWREAIHMVEAGIADAEDVDLVVRNSIGLRLAAVGPLENMDYIGLDLASAIHAYVYPDLGAETDVQQLLAERIEQGRLGAKSGAGIYDWPDGRREAVAARLDAHLQQEVREGAPGRADL